VTSPSNYSSLVNAFGGAARPNLLRPLQVSKHTVAAYYGTNVQINPVTKQPNPGYACPPDTDNGTCIFQQQSNSSFGTVRPGSLRGPSFQNLDFSVAKTFRVWREQRFDFRTDFFNVFNIADYGTPDSTMTDGNFGQITGTVSNSRSTQLSLKYAF
jgi:hypothetical protein